MRFRISSALIMVGSLGALLVAAAVIYGYTTRPGWVGVANKTLWDWLELFIVPIVIAAAGFLLSTAAERERELQQRERERLQEREQRERELSQERERAQDTALQAYLDQMNNLMVDKSLRDASLDSDPTRLAQAQTLAILMSLDGNRKRIPLKLVYELRLIWSDEPILNLKDAALDSADLSGMTLYEACLLEVRLMLSNLRGADLRGADLRGADLRGADLSDASLEGARLAGANLLPYDEKNSFSLTALSLSGNIDPSDIDPSDADLIPTRLNRTNLSGADLSGAYLIGAVGMTNEDLEQQAHSLRGATMPDGSNHP